jgi:hypothetical protein
VYSFLKKALSLSERLGPPVPAFDFDFVDRSGKALISSSKAEVGASALSVALNSANSGQPFDVAGQEENINYTVEYRDGEEQ